MGLSDRFLRRSDADSLKLPVIRQNKDGHKPSFDPGTLIVNTQKLGALSEPSFLSQIKS